MLIDQKIAALARTDPDKTAFIHNGVPCSYAEFHRRTVEAGRYFAQFRLPPGSAAALLVDNLAQAWVLGIALRRLGLNTVAGNSLDEIRSLGLKNLGCVVSWAPEGLRADASVRWIEVPAELEAGPAADAAAAPGGHILPTSGTTGVSKTILRDAAVEADKLDLHARMYGITGDSVVFVRDFPLGAAGGHRWPLMSWHQGATVVFQQGQDFHLPLLSPALTHAFATPMTAMFVLRAPELPVRRNDKLRLFVTGGAMPRALAAALLQRVTSQLYTLLASTEALTLGTTRVENLDELAWHRIDPSRQAQVVDEAGEPLPAGQLGLLRVRILDGVNGYLNDEQASRAFFRDGWFYSGDLAQFHQDGRLALCGRVTDVINVLGHKIAAAPIETALQNRLSADGVCLLSLARPGTDDAVHVAFEAGRNVGPVELQAAARELLKGLGAVHFHQFTQLPRNRMGKVMRTVLQQQLLERLNAS